MHYLISYDIESDRLRGRVAKTLERHGCHRVQRSVFVAPRMARRDWGAMLSDLRGLCFPAAGAGLGAEDSVLLVALEEAAVPSVTVLGCNNVLPLLSGDDRKAML